MDALQSMKDMCTAAKISAEAHIKILHNQAEALAQAGKIADSRRLRSQADDLEKKYHVRNRGA